MRKRIAKIEKSGSNPIAFSVRVGDVALFDFLVARGESIRVPNLWKYALRGPSYEILEKLLDLGADMYEIVDETLALNLLAHECRVEEALLLLRRGYDVNRPNPRGVIALQSAACALEDNVEMIDLLCEWGADVDAIGRDGRPVLALTVANICYNLDAFDRLLAWGANPGLLRMEHVAPPLRSEVKQRIDEATLCRRKELLACFE